MTPTDIEIERDKRKRRFEHDAYSNGYDDGVAAEREACARLIEDMDSGFDEFSPRSFAAAIRARKP